MAKKEYTRESIAADIESFKAGKLSKTNLTIDFMDAYVAKFQPEKIDEWIKKCVSIPMVKRKIGGNEKEVKDSKAIREYFIATFFPEQTEEAKKAAKEAANKAREAAKAAKEAEKKLSPADLLRKKMEELAKD